MKRKAIVLAAGNGKRMERKQPKVLHCLAHLPLIGHSLKQALEIADEVACVLNPEHEDVIHFVKQSFSEVSIFLQEKQQGTAHAVMQVSNFFRSDSAHILVLYADTPLLHHQTLDSMYTQLQNHVMSVLGFTPPHTAAYGRLIMGPAGLEKIVEAKDASKVELGVKLCNSGVIGFESSFLTSALPKLNTQNASQEYYITDLVQIARDEGHLVGLCNGDYHEVCGINTLEELSQAESIYQQRSRATAMEKGVLLQAPETVYFAYDTLLSPGVIVEPFVVFGPGVNVASGTTIRAFSSLEGTTIAEGASIGPYARLRSGTIIGENVHIGNFVETKKASFDKASKAAHLSYIGDAHIGEQTNIGAGTITCNYDGSTKNKTMIGKNVFVGSNTSLIAPICVGNKSRIGAGSVITKDVQKNVLSLSRPAQQSFSLKNTSPKNANQRSIHVQKEK